MQGHLRCLYVSSCRTPCGAAEHGKESVRKHRAILCQLVPGIPEAWVQDLLVGSLDCIEFCCSIWIVSLLVWMLCQSQFSVGLQQQRDSLTSHHEYINIRRTTICSPDVLIHSTNSKQVDRTHLPYLGLCDFRALVKLEDLVRVLSFIPVVHRSSSCARKCDAKICAV